MELRGDEVFHLNVLHYDRKPLRCDHLNRHHRATQMLVAWPASRRCSWSRRRDVDFTDEAASRRGASIRVRRHGGRQPRLGTWHWGPYPIADHVDLVNVQGKDFEHDNEVAHLERDLNTVVEVVL